MPHIKTKTVWNFDELSDTAKEKARQWFREGNLDYEWWDATYEDALRVAEILGIDINTRPTRLSSGKPGNPEHCIWFSGFSSQGDGACFEGHYSYAKGCAKKIREYAPQDKELHGIANALAAYQREAGYGLSATMKHSGHYYHSRCMSVDVRRVDRVGNDGEVTEQQETGITECMVEFADWIYKRLEEEHDYLQSCESVDETIKANEYEFTEDGHIA